ncbi:MAG: acyl-CoA dehydrogenase family protein [Candidatus Dormibacteraeota bacterium]|uniref:Acyl-CoA dehydrogenase family protein n=1 Tax=Candidatus Aeolococcus gillhamiae TaxID=3127015 RepID=A0A934N9G7_9BACT|nr:acyl-CoA dehydrogenase family protein [Candidatus Dormibacteraeota bacterium]
MDLSLTPSELQFRDEVRAWLAEHQPGPEPEGSENVIDFRLRWQRTLFDAGYVGISWPREHGGRGATLMEQAIFNEEMVRGKAPPPANVLGLVMGGPVIITHGTDEQRARFLAPILNGEEVWCQGFSEPNAGSDLAALTTSAVHEDGGWKINGQKVWTSLAHRAKWCMLVAKTSDDRPHHNLTYFICDMKQPGVEIRPLRQATGESEFNEIFFNDAFVPDDNVIGEVGDGWRVAITTLMFERAGLSAGSALAIKMQIDELAALIRQRGLQNDGVIRRRLSELVVATETMRLNGFRGLSRVIEHGVPGPEGSIAKVQWADINQRLGELALDVLGADGLAVDPVWTRRMLRARANSIEGGTSEIQRNILAERVLALPRMR